MRRRGRSLQRSLIRPAWRIRSLSVLALFDRERLGRRVEMRSCRKSHFRVHALLVVALAPCSIAAFTCQEEGSAGGSSQRQRLLGALDPVAVPPNSRAVELHEIG